MVYKLEFTPASSKQISKLDKSIQKRLFNQLDKIKLLDNPRDLGKALQGELSNYWSYRVGDYRLITRIEDNELLVILVKVSHRKNVYKN